MQKNVFLAFVLIFIASSVFAEVIQFDPNEDFSEGAYDLQPFVIQTEKVAVELDKYELHCKRLDEFTSSLADQILEDDLKMLSLQELLNKIMQSFNQKAKMVFNQNFLLYAFKKAIPDFDCDTTCETVYITLYKLQKKFPHYQIMGNFYLVDVPRHQLCGIKIASEILFCDLNKEVNEKDKLAFYNAAEYLRRHRHPVGMKLTLLKGEALKVGAFLRMAFVFYYMGDINQCSAYVQKGLECHPDDPGAMALKAQCLYEQDRHKEAIQIWERLELIYGYAPDYGIWALSLCQLGQFKEALALLERKLENAPKKDVEPLLYFARAKVYVGLAQKSQEKQRMEYASQALVDFGRAFGLHLDPNYMALRELEQKATQLGGEKYSEFKGACLVYVKVREILRERAKISPLATVFMLREDIDPFGVFKESSDDSNSKTKSELEIAQDLEKKAAQAMKFQDSMTVDEAFSVEHARFVDQELSVCQEYEKELLPLLEEDALIQEICSYIAKQANVRKVVEFLEYSEQENSNYYWDLTELCSVLEQILGEKK